MSFWFISALVLLVLVVLLVIVGIVLCLYLTINGDFQARSCSLTVIVDQHTNTDTTEKTVTDEPSVEDTSTTPLMRSVVVNPMEIAKTAGKVWSFVESNRAVVDVHGLYESFAPPNIHDPYKFQLWSSSPASHSFIVIIYNRLGRRIVEFEYTLQFVHSGSLNKKESYLNNVTIIPSRVSVSWGFKFNADVQISSVRNVGTHDRPIATASIDQHYRLIGLNTVQRTDSFEIRGDGKFHILNQSSRPNH